MSNSFIEIRQATLIPYNHAFIVAFFSLPLQVVYILNEEVKKGLHEHLTYFDSLYQSI